MITLDQHISCIKKWEKLAKSFEKSQQIILDHVRLWWDGNELLPRSHSKPLVRRTPSPEKGNRTVIVFACTQRSNALRRRSSPPRWLNMWSNIWSCVQACEFFCVFNWIDNTKLESCFCKSFQMISSTKPEKDMSIYESCCTFLFERCYILNPGLQQASFRCLQNKFNKPSGRKHGVYWKTKCLTA